MPLNDYVPVLIHILVDIYIIAHLYQLMKSAERRVSLIFFAFATTAYFLTSIYWVAYDLLYPMVRLPFAANEISELAIFLSLASSISAVTDPFSVPARWETAGALAFLAANVALWIGWSGEWVQDILTGIVMGYFFIRLIKHMKQTEALSAPIWKLLGIICAAAIALNTATFFVSDPLKDILDLTVFLLMLVSALYFEIRTILYLVSGKDPGVSISLSFAAYGWSILFLYMSEGLFYNIASYLVTISFLLMFKTLCRKETQSDDPLVQDLTDSEVLR